MVDFTASVPDTLLSQPPFLVLKGARRVISLAERHEVLESLDAAGCESEVSPGGSLANTLVAVSRLAHAAGAGVRVSMAGATSSDVLGQYFNKALDSAGVRVLVDPDTVSHTGTVMVLTTPDAQRSFLSFFDSGAVRLTPSMVAAIRASRMVVIEGYMLELPGAEQWVEEVARMARSCGAHVVLTAGDPGVVQRHRGALRGLLDGGLVDVLFCNREEACELLACCQQAGADSSSSWGGASGSVCNGAVAASALGAFVLVAVVTDGARGSHVCCLGELHSLGCAPVAGNGPVDVCGAGDAYAAGVLYAITQGHDLRTAAGFGARVAAAVIGRHGAQLAEEDAGALVAHLPNHVLLPQHWPASTSASSATP